MITVLFAASLTLDFFSGIFHVGKKSKKGKKGLVITHLQAGKKRAFPVH